MKTATIKQATSNHRNLRVEKVGYGTYKISCDYRGKRISTKTHDSQSVDLWNSDSDDKLHGFNCVARGYNSLLHQIISEHINNY
jgi:hypothetical protein